MTIAPGLGDFYQMARPRPRHFVAFEYPQCRAVAAKIKEDRQGERRGASPNVKISNGRFFFAAAGGVKKKSIFARFRRRRAIILPFADFRGR